jgi:diguanylate cyclase (GGDEF)-like protein
VESFDRITRLAKTLLQTPTVLVSLIDSDRQCGKSRQGLEATETPREISFCTHTIKQAASLIVPNTLEHPLFCNDPLVVGEPYIRFYIGVLLKMHDGHNIGTLCAIDHKPRELSMDQINAFHDLARMMVDELEFREIATTDSLTGILSRLGFYLKIDDKLKQVERYRRDFSFLALDIDHFKAVNDSYGHTAGDLALQTIVTQIKDTIRAVDFVGRRGGDEFVIALPESDIDGAMKCAERIRKKIADTVIPVESRNIRATVSIGISSYDRFDNGWKKMLERADAALYEAKKDGRNKCACHKVPSQSRLVA